MQGFLLWSSLCTSVASIIKLWALKQTVGAVVWLLNLSLEAPVDEHRRPSAWQGLVNLSVWAAKGRLPLVSSGEPIPAGMVTEQHLYVQPDTMLMLHTPGG